MISKRAIQNFLKKPLPPEESEAIARYLKENPDALTPFLNEEEWLTYLSEYHQHTTKPGDDLYEKGKLIALFERERKQKRQHRALRIAISVAASIIVICGISFFFLHKTEKPINPDNEVFVNTGTDSLHVSLKDGSQVHLAANSHLKFEITEENVRLATLDGGAYFAVRQDSLRPFMVKAQEIHSTVLGTSFSVDANKLASVISVSLHTGQLAVQYISENFSRDKYILQPGDVYSYSKDTQQEKLARPHVSEKINEKKVASQTMAEARELGDQWYMFNNQPLADVFNQLSDIYGIEIHYNKEDLKDLTFIGKIDKTDTLEHILDYLSKLNVLELSKKENQYFIKKIKQKAPKTNL